MFFSQVAAFCQYKLFSLKIMALSRGITIKCRVLLDLWKFTNKLYLDTQKRKAAMFFAVFIANLHNNKRSYSPSINKVN